MRLFWNNLFPIISIGIVCVKVVASDIITITDPLVVTKDQDFSSRQTTLQCSSSVQHEYCCWSIPDVGDCHCREKSCQKGVKVTSDEKVCSITIDHSEKDITIAGSWSCTLLHDVMDRRGGNATSELFVVDLNEVDINQFVLSSYMGEKVVKWGGDKFSPREKFQKISGGWKIFPGG